MIRFTRDYQNIGIEAPRWYNICAIIDNAWHTLNPENILFDNSVQKNIQIFSDPLISKVFQNLLENTLRHAKSATEVHVHSIETTLHHS